MVKENVAANAKKFMETPEALKAMLLCFDRDAANPVCQTWASALLRMATEEDANDVRVGVANAADLSVLVKFVLNHGTVKHKELLTTMLALLCRNATVVEEAVINAEGLTFVLKSLPKNSKTQGDVLEAGFVEIAMGSTNQEFASTQVALALADICSIPAGLEKIVACPRSVEALLQLLEFCPTTEGKAAAAVVIRTLFIRLCLNEDSTMQVTMTEACSHLILYIQQEDQQSQVKVFLEALAVFASGSKGRERIHEERGERTLMLLLKSTRDTEVVHYLDTIRPQELVAQMLAASYLLVADGLKTSVSDYMVSPSLAEQLKELYTSSASLLPSLYMPKQEGEGLNSDIHVDLLHLCSMFEKVEANTLLAVSLGQKLKGAPRLLADFLDTYIGTKDSTAPRLLVQGITPTQWKEGGATEREVVATLFPALGPTQSWRRSLRMGNFLNGHEPLSREIVFSSCYDLMDYYRDGSQRQRVSTQNSYTHRMYLSGTSADLHVALAVNSTD